jgi:hypothetical protein
MASIYKRGRVWWIHYIVAGKSVCRSLKTTSERVALEKKKQLEALQVTDQLVRPSSIPIKPFLQSFCEFLLGTRRHNGSSPQGKGDMRGVDGAWFKAFVGFWTAFFA